jgi:uncharacterized protein (DUF1697 family)
LRAVNVGGNNQISMTELRALLETLGYSDVATYIQSGNVVFASTARTSAGLDETIEAAINRKFGLRIDVVVRSARELKAAIDKNPFRGIAPEQAVHIAFLDKVPDLSRLAAIDVERFKPDEFAIVGREVYLHLPNGVGRSKLPPALVPKLAPSVATVRNWNTVTKLAEMAAR